MKTVIIFPCYNEEKRLTKSVFVEFLQKNSEFYFMFVDDGSNDASYTILESIQEEYSDRVFLKKLQKNSGKAEAVREGLLAAIELDMPIIGYADIDLATPLFELKRLALILQENDYKILLGSRVKLLGKKIERKMHRHYMGRVFATFASIVLNLGVYDTQCGAKFFKCKNVLREVLKKPFLSKWIFDVELIKRLLRMPEINADDFYEEPLNQWIDVSGSKLNFFAVLQSAIDLIKIAIKS